MHIKDFQLLMKDLYLIKDERRGVDKTFIWLVEEVGELASLLKQAAKNTDTDLESISSEMADILAWLCSLANIIGIDLEKALLTKYPLKCSKCGQNPCICTES